MRILISSDMEGISGIVDWDQVSPEKKEYDYGCELMTGDVNAAIDGAIAGGAQFVAVSDAHHDGRNLNLKTLDSRAVLNSGDQPRFSMLQDVQAEPQYDGIIYVGYHAMACTQNAVLCHTWWGDIGGVWINDRQVGEGGLNASLAGCFGIPVIGIAGDAAACREARALLGEALETAVVKEGTGYFSAKCLSLAESRPLIRETMRRAVEKLRSGQTTKPLVFDNPVKMRIQFQNPRQADKACLVPQVERVDGVQIEFRAADMLAANQLFRAAGALAAES